MASTNVFIVWREFFRRFKEESSIKDWFLLFGVPLLISILHWNTQAFVIVDDSTLIQILALFASLGITGAAVMFSRLDSMHAAKLGNFGAKNVRVATEYQLVCLDGGIALAYATSVSIVSLMFMLFFIGVSNSLLASVVGVFGVFHVFAVYLFALRRLGAIFIAFLRALSKPK